MVTKVKQTLQKLTTKYVQCQQYLAIASAHADANMCVVEAWMPMQVCVLMQQV